MGHLIHIYTQIFHIRVLTREKLQTTITVVQGPGHGEQDVPGYFGRVLVLSRRKGLIYPRVVGLRPSSPFLGQGIYYL